MRQSSQSAAPSDSPATFARLESNQRASDEPPSSRAGHLMDRWRPMMEFNTRRRWKIRKCSSSSSSRRHSEERRALKSGVRLEQPPDPDGESSVTPVLRHKNLSGPQVGFLIVGPPPIDCSATSSQFALAAVASIRAAPRDEKGHLN